MKRRSTLGWTPLREEDDTMKTENGFVTIKLSLLPDEVEWLRQKFTIEDKEDLVAAVWECVTTYMEL